MAKVYVGNLSWNTTDDGLAHAFSPFGQLTDYIVMKDRDTGRSRGFGFVTFVTQQEADAAIAALNEQELDGRRIRVNMANSRPPMGGMNGANLGYSGLTGGYGAGAYGAAQGGYGGYGVSSPPNAYAVNPQQPNFAYGQQAGYPAYQQQPYGAQPPGYPAPQPGYHGQQANFAYGAQQHYGAPSPAFPPPQPPHGGAGYGQGY